MMVLDYHSNIALNPLGDCEIHGLYVQVSDAPPTDNHYSLAVQDVRTSADGPASLAEKSDFCGDQRFKSLSHWIEIQQLSLMMIAHIPSYVYVTLALAIFLVSYQRRKRNALKVPLPPGPPADPLIGHLRHIPTKDHAEVYHEWSKTYGNLSIAPFRFRA